LLKEKVALCSSIGKRGEKKKGSPEEGSPAILSESSSCRKKIASFHQKEREKGRRKALIRRRQGGGSTDLFSCGEEKGVRARGGNDRRQLSPTRKSEKIPPLQRKDGLDEKLKKKGPPARSSANPKKKKTLLMRSHEKKKKETQGKPRAVVSIKKAAVFDQRREKTKKGRGR